jgi:ribosomal protein S19E (S16A)
MFATEPLKFYSVKDVPAYDFIRAYANYLKKNDKLELPKVPPPLTLAKYLI